jgi:flagellar hook-associated protein 2
MVSFTGIGSGMDLTALIDGLVAIERIPITQIEAKKSTANQQLTTLGNLVSRLASLKSSADALNEAKEVRAVKASTSADDVATAAVSNAAAVGSYNLRVTSLATPQVTVSQTYASTAAGQVGAGSIDIGVGSNTPVSVVLDGTETLDEVAAKINDAGAGVSAQLINDGTNYRIMIQGSAPGTANAVSFQENSISLGLNAPGANLSNPQDAVFSLNNLTITRSTNSVSDLLAGVTLNLSRAMDLTEPDVVVRVDNDPDALKGKVQDVATKFNEVLGLISVELSSGKAGSTARSLAGDSTLQGLQRRLAQIASSAYTHGGGTISLGAVGITLGSDGGLTIDSTKFAASLSSDPTALSDLLAGDGSTSFTARLKSLVDEYNQSGTGTLITKQSNLRNRISDWDDQIQSIEDRASRAEDRLRRTYTALDSKIAQLNSQFDYLASALGNNNNKS